MKVNAEYIVKATKYAYLNTYVNILFFIKTSIQNSTNKLRNFSYKRSASGHTAYPLPTTFTRRCLRVRDTCTRVH